ncbi:right origin-binding protein [Ruminiclostridium hungatei]|uniref:Right origin-binding protein n=1 Tax=Ruminiclostridium hungatei TaxID=48256 RepID=A0A1V4SKU5_RUMHU|nr:helix-turn-helix domain-containing protein [Ruminiclostridium hungatei]OPX44434.1 right origin-binding protein [Ruminiclostridium hungatei]
MHAWEQIQRTIEFIEYHLEEEIDIENLAKMASLSPFYYQRLFSRLVKKPVAEYVKLRRMAKATEAVLQKDKRILDMALELGFSSHEHFSRTFKDTFGMTPDEYRKSPQTLNRMTKPELLLNYTLIDEGVPLITHGIVLEVNRRKTTEPVCFTGVKKDMPVQFIDGLGIESGIDPLGTLWQNFHAQKQTALGLPEDNEEIGVAYPCPMEGYFSYFAGARSRPGKVPHGFMNWELPPGEYVVCSFEAENFEALVLDALYKAQQYIYNTWLPNRKLQTESFCAERYASHSPETTSMEIWLKLI